MTCRQSGPADPEGDPPDRFSSVSDWSCVRDA